MTRDRIQGSNQSLCLEDLWQGEVVELCILNSALWDCAIVVGFGQSKMWSKHLYDVVKVFQVRLGCGKSTG